MFGVVRRHRGDNFRLAHALDRDVGLLQSPLRKTGLDRVVTGRVRGEYDRLGFDRLRILDEAVGLGGGRDQGVARRLVIGQPDGEQVETGGAEHRGYRTGAADIPDLRNTGRKSAECGFQPELGPPALLVRDVERQRPVKRRLIAHFDFRDLRMSERRDCRERSDAKQLWCCLHHRFLLVAGKT